MAMRLKGVLVRVSAFLLAVNAVGATTLYVAATGRDSALGTMTAPFATLERARDEIRARRGKGTLSAPITVFVRGGVYHLAATLILDQRDSGDPGVPIVYRSYRREVPIVTVAAAIGGFVPFEGRILKANAAAQGFRGSRLRELFFDGKRQPLARYPNFDEKDPYGGGWAYADGRPGQDIDTIAKHSVHYAERDTSKWAKPEEGEVFVFPRYNGWNNIVPIRSVDPLTRTIVLAADCSYPIDAGNRYYVQNLLEELDAPGEWYQDRHTGEIYFWPPVDSHSVTVFAPRSRTILALGQGTSYVTFRGFTFQYFEGTGIALRGTSHCVVAANTIRNGGDYSGSAVQVDGGDHNGVVGNDIYDIGSNGIVIDGGGPRHPVTSGQLR
jgi:hypothetical protein